MTDTNKAEIELMPLWEIYWFNDSNNRKSVIHKHGEESARWLAEKWDDEFNRKHFIKEFKQDTRAGATK